MAFTLGTRTVTKVGIIGSGQIGPDIALHMTKAMQPAGVPVVVVDVSEKALAAGRSKLEKKIDKGVETQAFKPEFGAAMKANTLFTSDYGQLKGADLVIEAASEDLPIKRKIFKQLEATLAPDAILASNSSHMEPETIFGETAKKGRTAVIHYFFPAERNPLVEIVPGRDTEPALATWLMGLYEEIGKIPIRVGSRYGYAMDPIFEGVFHAACRIVEEGLGTVKQVDEIVRRALRQGVGPFTAMNLTGGNPLTHVGLQHYKDKLYGWYAPTKLMEAQIESGKPWDGVQRGEKVEVPAEAEGRIRDRILGAYFGIVGEILDAGISTVADLELGVQTGLVMAPPFGLMNEVGVAHALDLVKRYAKDFKGFPVPKCIERQAAAKKPFEIPVVLREDRDGVAVLTIRRPAVLNALNREVYEQLDRHVQAIEKDPSLKGAVITGYGRKAFVSGADVSMLAAVKTPADGEATSRHSHAVLNRIENSKKTFVCAYNGMAFGGGNELALACHARIAAKGLKVLAGQPEPNLGIIPGAGGTQRLPRVIPFAKAWEMLRTGKTISSAEGKQLGLISEEVEADRLLDRAAAIAREGNVKRIDKGPLAVPPTPPEIDLGHLSQAVDKVMRKAILEGAKMGLDKGLEFESKCFGEVCGLEDMKIGMENFIKNGPRAKAQFVNR
ncbi:MAG TPA: 3-hydroxyacyl-CoA dehydrogenase/enoyl-CoA hydratase family protein [Planctomycetota bacterium]|nr:3-hydroxyacyl-CoA dehydrogenase/enoyl-CoA hydratase family protein [Planctomycetota bacterium]